MQTGNPEGCDRESADLERGLSEVADLRDALAAMKEEMRVARRQIAALEELNRRLHRELVELARKEAQARDFAYHDELTKLPNRRLLRDRLDQALAHAARQHNEVVLLLVDLDGFKGVNDTLGHAAGDRLLQAVAHRLRVNLRVADTACRYGGDEFVVMLPEVDSERMAAAVTTKLRLALGEPYSVDGHEVRIAVSVGRVAYPSDGQTYEELLRKADEALYRAKPRDRMAVIVSPR